MSDRATLRRLLREHAEAVSTEIAFIKEDAILRLFDATQSEHDAQVVALTAALREANEDAARLAHSNTWVQVDDDGISAACIHCGKHAKYERDVIHRPDCPITLHRARVGGAV